MNKRNLFTREFKLEGQCGCLKKARSLLPNWRGSWGSEKTSSTNGKKPQISMVAQPFLGTGGVQQVGIGPGMWDKSLS